MSHHGHSVRLTYLEFVGARDPARAWLGDGSVDARFAESCAPAGAIVRGPDDLCELHSVIDDLLGVSAFERPPVVDGDRRTERLSVARPAAVMPFIESLRPCLAGRGPAFWTWKTVRESIALRLEEIGGLTVQAAR